MKRTLSTISRRRFSTAQEVSVTPLDLWVSHAAQWIGKKPQDSTASRQTRQDVTIDSQGTAAIARMFDAKPDVALAVFERLSPDRRRYFLVAASASEWFGTGHLAERVDQADSDGDAKISATDYRSWIERTLREKQSIPWATLCAVAFRAGVPFVAFGFLDNSLMILCGDAIDAMVGQRLALSAMGAAALGGVCSGALGVQFHGVTKRIVSAMLPVNHVRQPTNHRSFSKAKRLGTSVGIGLGLCLGMLPLILFSHEMHH